MELNLNFTQKISNIIPTYCVGTNEVNISKLLYRSLYEIENNQLRKDLVKEDTHNDEFTNWTITISDFEWSDGSKGSVADLVSTWEFIVKNNLHNASYLLNIKGAKEFQRGSTSEISGLTIIDELKISIKLNNPLPYLREMLANVNFAPMKIFKNQLQPYSLEDYRSNKQIITNNYKFIKSWNESELVIEDRRSFKSYKQYNFTFSNDYALILKKFKENKLHIHDGGIIDGDPNSKELSDYLEYYEFLSTYYLFFNMSRETKIPQDLRRKMMQKIHQNEKFIMGMDKVQSDRLVPGSIRNWEKKKVGSEQNIGNKKYIQSEPLIFICNDEMPYVDLSMRLIDLWKKEIQIDIKLEVYSWNEFISKLSSGDYDIARAGWVADFPHPHSFYEVMVSNSSSNFAKWNNKEFDELFRLSKLTDEQEKANEYFSNMDYLIDREVPIIPIYEHKLRQLISPNVAHFDISTTGVINYRTTKLKF
ncbi:ABC transporter substrate-binding protein [Rossellomorea aquimaris]|uniref:peptide ABC transporter substrate-binding protein n=1 Tax=Rossellomorea aquimaris TaxID=189382 RepID=UPI0011E8F965|nr:ABC transporter substrate-binding protein [Rossellomorea aquimaris]TYS83521.1 hypothetical protein FZC88_23445 [Rossellomorea aquimaris]